MDLVRAIATVTASISFAISVCDAAAIFKRTLFLFIASRMNVVFVPSAPVCVCVLYTWPLPLPPFTADSNAAEAASVVESRDASNKYEQLRVREVRAS